MKPLKPARWRPIFLAFTIWFVHFMACWVSAEIWPQQWFSHALAWAATAIALLALGAHFKRLKAAYAEGTLVGWHRRFAYGAIAIAAAAVVFGALPSVILLPPALQR